jgi:hypothetical protein
VKRISKQDGEPPAVRKLLDMIFAYRTSIGRLRVKQLKYGKV